jgi:transposase
VGRIRADYGQVYMLPPTVNDWVGDRHPARLVREFVDHLDLVALGIEVPEEIEGRPGYAADMLLCVVLYGNTIHVRTFRGMERSCRENMGMMFLTGGHCPDHSTLWRFWKANRGRFEGVCEDLVFVARRSKVVGASLQAVDGTKVAAQVSSRGAWHKEDLKRELAEIEQQVKAWMEEVEARRGEEPEFLIAEELSEAKARAEVIEASLRELAEVKRGHLHPADKDARMMKMPNGRMAMAYNAQVVADAESGLIVATRVVMDENDLGQLVPMIEKTVENLGCAAQVTVADAGYNCAEQLAEAESRGHDVLTCFGKAKQRPFHKTQFRYDAERDVVVCPKGQELAYERVRRYKDRPAVRLYRCRNAAACECRGQCSEDRKGRCVEVGPHDWAVDRQRELQKDEDNRGHLRRRGAVVELVFAHIKEMMGFRRFTVRGLAKVRAQWALICTAYNLTRLYRHWAAGALASG